MSRGRLAIITINALLLLVAVVTLVIQHLAEPPAITQTTTYTIQVTRSMTVPQILIAQFPSKPFLIE